jgi:hypothetical protein
LVLRALTSMILATVMRCLLGLLEKLEHTSTGPVTQQEKTDMTSVRER